MNLNYLINRKHIFKNRGLKLIKRNLKLNVGTSGIFSLLPQRFEFVYLRFFKKIIKKRYTKKRMKFRQCKFWFFLRPNYILTSKSINSRMGAGVGSLVRLAIQLKSYRSFIEFRNYSSLYLRRLYRYTRFKISLRFFLFFPK